MPELNLEELLERTGRRNFRCGRMTVRTLLTQIAELQGQVDDLAGQVAGRDETIQRVRAEHPLNRSCCPAPNPAGRRGHCGTCHLPYPCPTIVAFDGDPADDGTQK